MSLFSKTFVIVLLLVQHMSPLCAAGFQRLSDEASQQLKEHYQPRRIILAIGVNEFSDPFWNDLQFAESDAQQIHRFFTEEAQIPFDKGELLTSSSVAGGLVTRQDILDALERLKKLNINEDDTVVVYLSTHGTIYLRKDKTFSAPSAYVPYFVVADTQHRDIQNTAISRDELLSFFQTLKSQRKALIIATCHSGGGKAQITPEIREAMKSLKGDIPELHLAGQGYSILAASSWSEPAVESKELAQDIYTHFLLQAMRNNKDRAFTLTQAHDSATRETILYTNNLQHPTIQMDQSGGDPIVLSGDARSRGLAYLYSYLQGLKKLELRVGGQSKGLVGDGYLAVPEGKHRFELIDPESQDVVASRVVRLQPGKEYSVASLMAGQKRWHMEAGVGAGRFYSTEARKSLASRTSLSSQVSVRRDEAIGIWDITLSLDYQHPLRERIRIDQKEFTQLRRALRARLSLGTRETLASSESGILHQWGWFMGPSLLQWERSIEGRERDSVEGAHAKTLLPGLGVGVLFASQYVRNGLQWGINAQLESYVNQGLVQDAEPLVPFSQVTAFFGVGW